MTWAQALLSPSKRFRRQVGIAALILLLIALALPPVILMAIDGGALDGPLKAAASAWLGRTVEFGRLRAHLLSGDPSLTIDHLVVGNPSWAGPGPFLTLDEGLVRLRLLPLLIGRFEPVALTMDGLDLNLKRVKRGQDNWTFQGHNTGLLSRLSSLDVSRGRLAYDDWVRDISITGVLAHQGARSDGAALTISGAGTVKAAPVIFSVNGPHLQGRPGASPYPMSVQVQDGATQVSFIGVTKTPFDLLHFDFDAHAQGPNLADLHYLFGLLAPNSRAYVLDTRVRKDGPRLYFDRLQGRVGASDLSGSAFSDRSGARPLLKLLLGSNHLAREDVEASMAAAPSHQAARSQVGSPTKGTSGRLFSGAPFDVARLQAADFHAVLKVGVLTGYEPVLRGLSVTLDNSDGLLTVDPVTFETGPGSGRASLVLDARRSTPRLKLQASLIGARLAQLRSKHTPTVDGVLDLWVSATGSGHSMAQIAASANGRAAFGVAAGHLPRAQAAVLGGDTVSAIGALLDHQASQAPLRCAVGEFSGASGIFGANTLVLAVGDGEALGGGSINLRSQTYDLRLQGEPRDRGLFQRGLPIAIGGPLDHPKAKLDIPKDGGSALKVVVGAVLAPVKALASRSPLAAEVDCPRLLGQVQAFATKAAVDH